MQKFSLAQLLYEVHEKRAADGLSAGPFHPLIVLSGNQTLGDALQKLHAHKIISAPIRNEAGGWAVLDMLDVALALLNAAKYKLEAKQLFDVKLSDCYAMVALSESIALPLQSTVGEAVVAITHKDLHRVIIVDAEDDNKPVGVVSQMDIVRFVTKHWDLVDRSIREQCIGPLMRSAPVTVSSKATVAAALEVCAKQRYSGIGVVDESGQLIGNFSVSDLRVLEAAQIAESLQLSIEVYLHRTKKFLVKDLITCKSSTRLEEAAKLMLQHHVHRLFVQDETGKPVGVLTTTDVCHFIALHLKQ